MVWADKRAKNRDANLKKVAGTWHVRVKLKLPDASVFDRIGQATTVTEARVVRDDLYKTYNQIAREILAGIDAERDKGEIGLTLQELAERCRDEWWPARGRSVEIAEQYFQKLHDYVVPVLGADRSIREIGPEAWDRVLASIKEQSASRKKPLREATIRKVKACFSSALSCAVTQKRLLVNPIKGLPYNPNPLTEADRLGQNVEDTDDDGPDKRSLSMTEVTTLLAKSKGTLLYPVVVLQLGFGLRIAEALAVRWSDFDWAHDELRIRAQAKWRRNPAWQPEMSVKGFHGAKVPKTLLQRVGFLKSRAGRRDIRIFSDTAELLKGLPRGTDCAYVAASETGRLLDPRNAQRMYRDLFVRAKLAPKKDEIATWTGPPSPSSHSLRSWRLSHFANVLGLPESHLQRIAGHSRIETTMRYYVRSSRESLTLWLSQRGDLIPAPSPLAPAAHPLPDQSGTGQSLQS